MSPVEPREGAPTAKRAQVQADVLQATEELLAGGASFAELNVERIATAAGISRTAFYFYFRDKRELLMRLAGELTEALYAQADIWFSGHGDPAEEVRTALRNIRGLYDEHGPLLRAIVEVSATDAEIAGFWRSLLGRFVDATSRRIEAEASPALPPDSTAFALVWMVERSFYQWLVQESAPPRDEQVEALVGIWLRTIYGTTTPPGH
ncbi:MAG TPA: TetR/AcrR family transcriptional regulator [Baekduia sp.]|nr:TetR/AcrR family transcriptional regulator [Baekduia sp.]